MPSSLTSIPVVSQASGRPSASVSTNENSEVLPAGSVAVAETFSMPTSVSHSTCPYLSVVTCHEPSHVSPSPAPDGSGVVTW